MQEQALRCLCDPGIGRHESAVVSSFAYDQSRHTMSSLVFFFLVFSTQVADCWSTPQALMNRIVVEYDSKKTLQAFVTSHSALEAQQSMGTYRRISKR